MIRCICYTLLLLAALGGSPPCWAIQSSSLVVTVPILNVRQKPVIDSPVIGKLKKGDRLPVLDIINRQWLVIQHRNAKGFVLLDRENLRLEEVADGAKKVQTTLKSIKTEIKKKERQGKKLLLKEKDLLATLSNTDRQIQTLRSKISAESDRLADIHNEMKEIQKKIAKHEKKVKFRLQNANNKINVLYRYHRNKIAAINTRADTIYDIVRREYLLQRILQRDHRELDQLTTEIRELKDEREKIKLLRDDGIDLEGQLKKSFEELKSRKKERLVLLKKVRSEKDILSATIEQLKKSALRLDQKINRLSKQQKIPPHPPGSFERLKGQLRSPVFGTLVSRFGPYKNSTFNTVNFRSGLTIKVEIGEPVHSIAKGTVIFAEWFKGYGNLMIIDHGEGYYSLYGHLEDIFKEKGSLVDKEEVIATAGDSGSMHGPALYFEIRSHGKALNPEPWLKFDR